MIFFICFAYNLSIRLAPETFDAQLEQTGRLRQVTLRVTLIFDFRYSISILYFIDIL